MAPPLGPRVSRKAFHRAYSEKTRTLIEIAGNLPDRPNPEQIHDLRVTIRRLQVMRRLLPLEIRNSLSSRKFGLILTSILKGTSQLRDLDTQIATLEPYREVLMDVALVTLSNQRSDAAARAKAVTDLLTESPPPDPDQLETRNRGLSRRLRRRIKKRGRLVSELLDQVLKDETKVEELHTLRKEVKKLRYYLELAEQTPAEHPVLTRWQESLGSIRDLDVAIGYLRSSTLNFNERIVRELAQKRHAKYVNFIGEYRRDSLGALSESQLLLGPRRSSPAELRPKP
jgi:CHAD domain-containing protein